MLIMQLLVLLIPNFFGSRLKPLRSRSTEDGRRDHRNVQRLSNEINGPRPNSRYNNLNHLDIAVKCVH